MDAKLKYLEFIQAIISRMSNNSFMLKGWCITLISALFALAAKDTDPLYVLVAYIPIPAFWLLDGYYLSLERQYRELYKKAIICDPNSIDFSLDAREFNTGRNTWLSSLISPSIWILYSASFLAVLVVMFVIVRLQHG